MVGPALAEQGLFACLESGAKAKTIHESQEMEFVMFHVIVDVFGCEDASRHANQGC